MTNTNAVPEFHSEEFQAAVRKAFQQTALDFGFANARMTLIERGGLWNYGMARIAVRYLARTACTTELRGEALDIPVNWWNMLKRDHFPAWLKRWMPVKTRQVRVVYRFEHTYTCPHIKIAEHKPHFRWLEGKG